MYEVKETKSDLQRYAVAQIILQKKLVLSLTSDDLHSSFVKHIVHVTI